MTEKEIDDYFCFLDGKVEELKSRVDTYCLSLNTTRDELLSFFVKTSTFTREMIKEIGKDREKLHDTVMSLQHNDRHQLGFCYCVYDNLKQQIKNKNLLESFKAYEFFTEGLNAVSNREINESNKSNVMRKYAKLRLANDPKQKALDEISSHYVVAKHQFRRRGYTAQFVKEMAKRYPIIESPKTIERLVAKLNKINKPPVS